MKTVALVSDSHFDESSRFDECVHLHEVIARDLRARPVDLVVHAGDVFHRRSTATERRAVARWLLELAEVAPVLLVRGNHDLLGELPLFSRLRSHYPIVAEERAGVHVLGGVAVAAVAWPRKSELLARLGPVAHDVEREATAGALSDLLRGLDGTLAQHEEPRLVVAHAMVSGALTSAGQPLVGVDFELPLHELALPSADAVALGHVHRAQEWRFDDRCIFYVGSPRRTDFGELEEKSYVRLTFGDRVPHTERAMSAWARATVAIERVRLPSTPMLHLDYRWINGTLVPSEPSPSVAGAEVRLRYRVPADERAVARLHAKELAAALGAQGAVHVKLEAFVEGAPLARAPAIAKATSLDAKLRVLWATQHRVPDEARSARLFERLRELENQEGGVACVGSV